MKGCLQGRSRPEYPVTIEISHLSWNRNQEERLERVSDPWTTSALPPFNDDKPPDWDVDTQCDLAQNPGENRLAINQKYEPCVGQGMMMSWAVGLPQSQAIHLRPTWPGVLGHFHGSAIYIQQSLMHQHLSHNWQ